SPRARRSTTCSIRSSSNASGGASGIFGRCPSARSTMCGEPREPDPAEADVRASVPDDPRRITGNGPVERAPAVFLLDASRLVGPAIDRDDDVLIRIEIERQVLR